MDDVTDQASPALWRFIQDDDPDAFTLVVETANGPYIRRIRPALPLPSDVEHGPGAEAAVHTAAATWGLSDFVFQPAYASKGSGRRELGDRLLLAGGRGAVIQVKARTVQPKDISSEVAWIKKVAAKAVRQAKGTVRQLRMLPADMTNGRGCTLSVDGNAYEWIGVFLLDHEQVPEGTICPLEPIGIPTIALTRRDWDFLFDQLRSTTAVLDYLFRAAVEPPVALGEEPVRYYEFAAADAEAPPGPLNPEVAALGGTHFSTPLLPQAPVGSDQAHRVMRIIMEDVATSAIRSQISESNRQLLLSDLDKLPVGARAEWGQLLLDMLADVQKVPAKESKWRWRRSIDPSGTRQLIFGCATRFGPEVEAAFQSYVLLRHHQLHQETGLAAQSSTLGVLLTPRTDGRRPWDTTLLRTEGDNNLSPEEVEQYIQLWNPQTAETA